MSQKIDVQTKALRTGGIDLSDICVLCLNHSATATFKTPDECVVPTLDFLVCKANTKG